MITASYCHMKLEWILSEAAQQLTIKGAFTRRIVIIGFEKRFQ